uniref:hypothetical protein n=1 Tax=Alistipes sp. D31t1_170403_E11 TaxID=2787128 RepID=UPI001898C5B9|nr:hypothetical protein [Alistipes sp. D31t1_170403_E11]
MKKIKILFCGLLVGLSVLSYLIATHKNITTELLLLNVEALSLNEELGDGCVVINGTCFDDYGNYVYGMRYAD